MIDTRTFWHVSEYETSKTLKRRKINSYVVYGEWEHLKSKLEKRGVNFTITAITPKDFRNFKPLMDL